MNKFINLLLLFFGMSAMLFTIVVSFDFPLTFLNTSGAQLEYRFKIFLIYGLVLLVINLRRSVRRWMGMRLVNQLSKFKWNSTVSDERIKRVKVYNFLEALIMMCFGLGMYWLTPETWMILIAMVFGAVDSVVFAIYGSAKKKFRTGLTSKALIIADRDVIVLYFNGLRKVSPQQQSIYFDYIKDLQLSFPTDCIREDEQAGFFKVLKETLNPDKVYFSKKLAE